ncbi:ABC transporter permease [Cryobacterium sp. Y50]|uniref:ABC transporter permease n=1 Tax=Cryobacterium sp. Y50 TaxID=2048286 RepID=UPI0018EC90DC|nr:ABC transporter permease [Cryobacterium sp. Y50]
MAAPLLCVAATDAAPAARSRAQRLAVAVAQQVGVLVASLLAASLLIFLALHYLPGDAAAILAGPEATAAQVALLEQRLGLDRPVAVQYLDWVFGALRLDLGDSMLDGRSVASQIGEKLQVTVPLCVAALLISVLVALPLGMIAGARHRTWYGHLIGALTQLGVALPVFAVGLALVTVVAVKWRVLPVQGFPPDRWADPAGAIHSLILPTITLAIPLTAGLVRFVRSATIDIVADEWVRTARAQGWSIPSVLMRQGLRNAALPLVAIVGLELAGLLMGSVLIEQVFALPGIGQMLLKDVGNRDIVSVQGTLLALTSVIMIVTIALNIVYTLIDPRLRGSK